MLHKLFIVALLLAITFNLNHAVDDETESPSPATNGEGVTTETDDNNTDDLTDDTTTDNDVDDNGDDINDIDNNGEDDDDESVLFQSTDMATTDSDSPDDTDSVDATEATDSNSNDDVSDSNDDNSNSIDVDSDEEDLCVGLTQSECGSEVRDDGDAECAYNAVSGDCYDIERREGRMGSGNFDDGYNTAKKNADDEQAQLELLVTVLSVVIGLLVLVIIGGAVYVWKKSNSPKVNHHQMDQSMEVDGADRLINEY